MVGTDNISKILIDNITCEDLIEKYIEKNTIIIIVMMFLDYLLIMSIIY